MVKRTHNSFSAFLGLLSFYDQSSFRSERTLNFIFLSNKLLSPWFIHCSFFFASRIEWPARRRCCCCVAFFFSTSHFFKFFALNWISFRFYRSYFYSFLPSTHFFAIQWIVILLSADSLFPIVSNFFPFLFEKIMCVYVISFFCSLYLHLRYNIDLDWLS